MYPKKGKGKTGRLEIEDLNWYSKESRDLERDSEEGILKDFVRVSKYKEDERG